MIESIFGSDLNVLLRSFAAFWLSLIIYLVFGARFIRFLHKHQEKGQPIRTDGPKTHLQKKGTPTMGGILILLSVLFSSALFADLDNRYIWVCFFVIVAYGLAGFLDDYEKITRNSSKAMSVRMKLLLQFFAALVAVCVITYITPDANKYVLNFPFFVGLSINLKCFYIPFAMVVVTGASNGVNLSDGLDGLAAGLLIFAFGALIAVAYYVGCPDIMYLRYIKGAGEVAVICSSVVGACMGFLWFNAPKAKVFMGDTGSLALGALLGTIGIILKEEILLGIIGGVFVVETISVFLQVLWFKRTGKRLFRMAPIHHHFEQLGMPETTVTIRFWIIGFILGLIGLCALFTGIRFYN